MKEHELKCWPPHFGNIVAGLKTFELRKCDRDFTVGDILYLKEFIPCRSCSGRGKRRFFEEIKTCVLCNGMGGGYTTQTAKVKVIHILKGSDAPYGIDDDYCIMSIKLL